MENNTLGHYLRGANFLSAKKALSTFCFVYPHPVPHYALDYSRKQKSIFPHSYLPYGNSYSKYDFSHVVVWHLRPIYLLHHGWKSINTLLDNYSWDGLYHQTLPILLTDYLSILNISVIILKTLAVRSTKPLLKSNVFVGTIVARRIKLKQNSMGFSYYTIFPYQYMWLCMTCILICKSLHISSLFLTFPSHLYTLE